MERCLMKTAFEGSAILHLFFYLNFRRVHTRACAHESLHLGDFVEWRSWKELGGGGWCQTTLLPYFFLSSIF